MQNRYVGDVGDFGKYGFLKALSRPNVPDGHPHLRLGVIWYLVPDEDGHDGKHTTYLEKPQHYRACDPELFDALKQIVHSGERRVSMIRQVGILPQGTVFHDDEVHTGLRREAWLRRACQFASGSDIVFLDPDNGLLPRSVTKGDAKAPKYVFPEELPRYLTKRQTLVVYQHSNRTLKAVSAEEQARVHLRDLCQALDPQSKPFALVYRRGTSRAFLIVPGNNHIATLTQRAQAFTQFSSPWITNGHFSTIIWCCCKRHTQPA